MKQQWVKVTRPDGAVQYATKDERGEYFLYGSGFSIRKFCKGTIVEDIEETPPQLLRRVVVGFEDAENSYRNAVVDDNKYWNGWAVPFIHKNDIKSLIDYLNKSNGLNEGHTLELRDDGVVIEHTVDDEDYEIHPEVLPIDGELYYEMGLGFCWDVIE